MKKRSLWCLFLCGLLGLSGVAQTTSREDIELVKKHITDNWAGSIDYNPEDKGNLFGLPKPYNVPTVAEANHFKEMYYWDTYFTNCGLIYDDPVQARNNVDNILFMVKRFGKMLNGSNRIYLNRSQPPYLSMMVADVYAHTQDKEWLKEAVGTLEKEYKFWMTERITPCGLNRYSSSANEQEKLELAQSLCGRFGEPALLDGLTKEEILKMGAHFIAEAESGWDFNPRFESRCEDFCPVDLNCNLYLYEKNFERFYQALGNRTAAAGWRKVAKRRSELINRLCFDPERGIYFDYDYVNKRTSGVVSVATMHPLFVGMATSKIAGQVVRNALSLLELPHGIQCCEKKEYGRNYQWAETNGWAPLHYITVVALKNYHFDPEAKRVGGKYIDLVCRNFKMTGNLWEKYNVQDGTMNAYNEYKMPPFLGWTAGVFIYIVNNI